MKEKQQWLLNSLDTAAMTKDKINCSAASGSDWPNALPAATQTASGRTQEINN